MLYMGPPEYKPEPEPESSNDLSMRAALISLLLYKIAISYSKFIRNLI